MTCTGLQLQLLVTASPIAGQAMPVQGRCQWQVCSRHNSRSCKQDGAKCTLHIVQAAFLFQSMFVQLWQYGHTMSCLQMHTNAACWLR
jgi:hypothetical protein